MTTATHYAINSSTPPVSIRLPGTRAEARAAFSALDLAAAYDSGSTHAEDDLGIDAADYSGAWLADGIGITVAERGTWRLVRLVTAAEQAECLTCQHIGERQMLVSEALEHHAADPCPRCRSHSARSL